MHHSARVIFSTFSIVVQVFGDTFRLVDKMRMSLALFRTPKFTADLRGLSAPKMTSLTMARFIITTKHVKNSNGIRIEPGMRVEVITQTMSNPVITNGGQVVADAFMRIYGIDIKKAGCLNMVELDVVKV